MTAQQLAGELEVSVRTIYRDVEALSAAPCPGYLAQQQSLASAACSRRRR